MQVDIELVGKTNRWQPKRHQIRIGRDSSCDVSLSEYSMVSREHAVLEVEQDGLRLSDRGSANGTFLNGEPVQTGFVRSGDVIRFGAEGPELCIRLTADAQAAASVAGKAPPVGGSAETVLRGAYVGGVPSAPTRLVHSPVLGETVVDAAPAGSGPPGAVHVRLGSAPESAAQAVPAAEPHQPAPVAPSEGQQSLARQLHGIRNLLVANLVILVLLLLGLAYQVQQVAGNREELGKFHRQAESAVGLFMPDLKSRLDAFEKRMDGVDSRMKAAEDRFVDRMNRELPATMDKYLNRKMDEFKKQTGVSRP